MEALLLLTLVHETAHYIKRYSKNGSSIYELNTIEEDNLTEGGKIFFNYLFNKPEINIISLEQAKLIVDFNVWKDEKQLKRIFKPKPSDSSATITFIISEYDTCMCLRTE